VLDVSTGWVDPGLKVQNIPILKNGTNYIRQFVSQWNWVEKSISLSNTKTSRFVIIRDPYERWLSGFAEDLELYFIYNKGNETNTFANNDFNFESDYILNLFKSTDIYWFFDFLIDKDLCKIDGHSNLQFNAIKNIIDIIGIERLIFIKMTNRLGDTLNYFLGTKQVRSHFTNEKIYKKNIDTNIIYNRVIQYFSDPRNNNRKERVLDYLTLDYQLYNSVKFINNN